MHCCTCALFWWWLYSGRVHYSHRKKNIKAHIFLVSQIKSSQQSNNTTGYTYIVVVLVWWLCAMTAMMMMMHFYPSLDTIQFTDSLRRWVWLYAKKFTMYKMNIPTNVHALFLLIRKWALMQKKGQQNDDDYVRTKKTSSYRSLLWPQAGWRVVSGFYWFFEKWFVRTWES